MPIVHPHAERFHERRMHVLGSQRVIIVNTVGVAARWPIRPLLGLWESKVHQMGDSLPWTPMNRRAKFYTASFILREEIRNRTNQQTNTQTRKQTVNDIPTPCLSTCVDNKSFVSVVGLHTLVIVAQFSSHWW